MSAFVRLRPNLELTTPEAMEKVLDVFPRLARHSCVNGKGPTFAAVMDCTSWAHVLEHLVIDLQVSAHQDRGDQDDPWFVGNTQWLDRSAGTARIQVSYRDDLVALKAFKDGVAFLNDLGIS